jgi:ubiquitin carboxyl-terminal hydrolase 14
MPAFNVTVKWGRETFPEIVCNTDEDPTLFKAQLFTLTGVAPARQKVMVRGKTLSDSSWDNFPIKSGAVLLLMGSKEEDFAVEPTEKVKFVEDMNDSELTKALELPPGLANLGNTCYMNATVQCLKTVAPLTQSLKKFQGNVGNPDSSVAVTAALRDLYNVMDRGVALPPAILLQTMHTAFPRFAERGENGIFIQQDANECWIEIMRMLQHKLPAEGNKGFSSVIDEYFSGKLEVEWKCDESEAEEVQKTTENFLQLSCFITTDVKYMHSGLREKLVEKVTKHSPVLNADAVYTKSSKISRLPAFLTIQMIRFFFKEKSSTNVKILKDVKFPMVFDAYDLCTKELQEKLLPMRNKFKEMDDKAAQEKLASKDKIPSKGQSKKVANTVPYSFADDSGSNNSGFYELQAVLTHKGRSSSSGHYLAWVRYKEDVWLKCDDDDVTPVTEEEILKLSGGGDWHCAYVFLYGPKILQLPEGQTMEPVKCKDPVPMETVDAAQDSK